MGTDIIEELKNILERALKKFYDNKNERELLLNKGTERTCVFRIGLYINDEMNKNKLNEFKLDSEYNKHLHKPKVNNKNRIIRPDLIIHKRGQDDNNIMAIEFKGYWNKRGVNNDIQKLKDFINEDYEYHYKIGALVILGKENPEITFFSKS